MGTLRHYDLVGIAAPLRSPTARRRHVQQFWPGAFARACADTWNEIRIDHRRAVVSGGREAILLAECVTGLLFAVRFPDRSDAATFKRAAVDGAFVGCSVSMERNEMRTTVHAGVRTITDAGPLLEISLVSTASRPAYDNTWVMSTDDDRWQDRLWSEFVAEMERGRCFAYSMTRAERHAQLSREQSPAGDRYRALMAGATARRTRPVPTTRSSSYGAESYDDDCVWRMPSDNPFAQHAAASRVEAASTADGILRLRSDNPFAHD